MIKCLFVSSLVTLMLISCSKDPPPSTTPPPGEDTVIVTKPPVELSTKVLVDDLDFPWELFWGPDNQIWFTERTGKISKVDPESGTVTPLITINDIFSVSESGLLGMVMPADIVQHPYLFTAYNYKKAGENTIKVVRYSYQNNVLTNPVIIMDDIRGGAIHNGCRLVISSDLQLFITTGDADDQDLPQNISAKNGKVLRINFDGTIPPDNPDPSSPMWSYGHRNPQGLVFVNDSLFSSEHGPDTDDEVNMIHKGSNYGWPNVKGMCDADEESFCNDHHVIEPLIKWTPTIAPSGLDYYDNDLIPQWKNSLLLCTLKDTRLVQLSLNANMTTIDSTKDFFINQFGRLRDVCISPSGKVYICTSNGTDDKIIEIGKK